MTKRCIASIPAEAADKIIIVDDGSPWVPPYERSPRYETAIRLEVNGGYPVAVNAGMRKAKEYEDRTYACGWANHRHAAIILNNDATLEPGCIEAIMRAHMEIKQGVVTATEIGRDTLTPSGAMWCVDRGTWANYGPLDESFGKGACEETDFFLKLRSNNVKVTRCPSATIRHIGSATIKRTPEHREQFKKNVQTLHQRWGTATYLFASDAKPDRAGTDPSATPAS